jgi:hypothetical protein
MEVHRQGSPDFCDSASGANSPAARHSAAVPFFSVSAIENYHTAATEVKINVNPLAVRKFRPMLDACGPGSLTFLTAPTH